MCEYQIDIPNIGACCGAYEKIQRADHKVWCYYPPCISENCPLVHPELVLKEEQQ